MHVSLASRMQTISPFYVMDLLHRAKQLEAQGRDVIHMEIGEPDFPTPQPVIDAAVKHLETGEVKYTSAAGLLPLREKIAAFYQQRYGVTVSPQRIFVTPGASGAFLLALGVSLNADEEILMADPCYPCNSNFVALFGGKTTRIAVDAVTRYQLTADLIKQHWTTATKGVLVASPSNPTGTLIADDPLKEAIASVHRLGGCFYSDEIYHGLAYGHPAASALQYSDGVFVINSFSKYFGMTGWRIGWLIVPDGYTDAAERLAQNIFIATSTHSQYAALAAFDDSTLAELERRRGEFAKRRDFLYENLVRLGFTIPIKPEGAFYLYANCANLTDDSHQFALDLLAAQAVAITPGKDFGNNQPQQWLRFAYTTSIGRMAEAMARLERFITVYKRGEP